ncbi:MAG: four helix bundle protein [Bacteroidales bacterium]|nr:four helix bundle protein [Bacteroidales bacterium]
MDYKELDVWKESKELVKLVYSLTNSLPVNEQFGLTNQIRRSAVSVPSNIAEGVGRNHSKDTIQFLYIARGSLYELETQLIISNELFKYSSIEYQKCWDILQNCKMLINGFINYYQKKR